VKKICLTTRIRNIVKLSLSLAKHHAMKTYREMEVWRHIFLTSALEGGECSALRSGHGGKKMSKIFMKKVGTSEKFG
jgi:hypothetical protein